jgi:hypothetical protein
MAHPGGRMGSGRPDAGGFYSFLSHRLISAVPLSVSFTE